MAIAAWKRLEKTPGYQKKKRFFKRLVGKELKLGNDIEVPVVKDGGWWYAPGDLDGDSIVYSLGVGDDIDFDLAIIEKYGVDVHAFDPTPSTIEMLEQRRLPDRFSFHPWAVTASNGTLTFYPRLKKDGSKSDVMYTMVAEQETIGDAIEVPAYSLATICSRLGHERVDLMKVDIEGAEYEVLDGLLASSIRPQQLLVEFHHRFPGIGLQKTADLIKRLRDDGYKIFAVSEAGREVSFLRR